MRQDVLIVERRRSYIVCDALDANIDCERDAGVGRRFAEERRCSGEHRRVPGVGKEGEGAAILLIYVPFYVMYSSSSTPVPNDPTQVPQFSSHSAFDFEYFHA